MGWSGPSPNEKVYNSLPASNTVAISFLLDHAFDIEAVRSDHYRIGHGYTDEVMLARTLEAASPVFGRN